MKYGSRACSGMVSFLLGGAVAVGTALVFRRINKKKSQVEGKPEGKIIDRADAPEGIYCAVPEGADICYP
jgi:hypothetical protein